jgi:integration host factor subunit beta
MNKAQLIEALAKAENVTLKKAEMVINAIFENMADALVQKERIEISGFGSFKVEGKKLPFFKVGKELRQRVDH